MQDHCAKNRIFSSLVLGLGLLLSASQWACQRVEEYSPNLTEAEVPRDTTVQKRRIAGLNIFRHRSFAGGSLTEGKSAGYKMEERFNLYLASIEKDIEIPEDYERPRIFVGLDYFWPEEIEKFRREQQNLGRTAGQLDDDLALLAEREEAPKEDSAMEPGQEEAQEKEPSRDLQKAVTGCIDFLKSEEEFERNERIEKTEYCKEQLGRARGTTLAASFLETLNDYCEGLEFEERIHSSDICRELDREVQNTKDNDKANPDAAELRRQFIADRVKRLEGSPSDFYYFGKGPKNWVFKDFSQREFDAYWDDIRDELDSVGIGEKAKFINLDDYFSADFSALDDNTKQRISSSAEADGQKFTFQEIGASTRNNRGTLTVNQIGQAVFLNILLDHINKDLEPRGIELPPMAEEEVVIEEDSTDETERNEDDENDE